MTDKKQIIRRAVIASIVSLLLVACPEDRPACAPATLAAIEARCTTEQLLVIQTGGCDGYRVLDECPALDPVRKACDVRRQEWIQCR